MATSAEVLRMLIPNGGWYCVGDTFEGVEFLECEPITKKQFTDCFAQYDNLQKAEAEAKASARQVILDRLGLTADEAKLLLG